MARKSKSVRVQKYLNGRPKNAPFQMQETRAQELVEAHKRSTNGVYYEILDPVLVEPVTRQQPEPEKKSLVAIEEMTGGQVVDWLATEPAKEHIVTAMNAEKAGKNRVSIVKMLDKAWKK